MRKLAIIPVKKYSQRLADKNFLQVAEYPMYWWSVEAALESKLFNDIVVSTDAIEQVNLDIKKNNVGPVVRTYKRPPELCSSTTKVSEVCVDVINLMNNIGEESDLFCLLLPTNPLRTAENIKDGLNFFKKVPSPDFVMSVSKYSFSAWYALQVEDSSLAPIKERIHDIVRQELSDTYYLDGAVCWAKVEAFMGKAEKKIAATNPNTLFFQIPPERAVDVDDELDLELARVLMGRRR